MNMKMKYEGTCSCGAVHVGLLTEPFLKYNCHCSICRRFVSKFCTETDEPKPKPEPKSIPRYNTAVAVWRWAAIFNGEIEYDDTTNATFGLFGVSRGRCRICKDPVCEIGRRLFLPLAMVMSPTVHIEPDVNLHYDSGLKQGPDDMRLTLHTDVGTIAYEIWILLTVAIPTLPYSLFAWLFQPKAKEKM